MARWRNPVSEKLAAQASRFTSLSGCWSSDPTPRFGLLRLFTLVGSTGMTDYRYRTSHQHDLQDTLGRDRALGESGVDRRRIGTATR